MEKELISFIANSLDVKIEEVVPVSGGDISKAYHLESERGWFFCKINNGNNALSMFASERKGLEAISKTDTVMTPRIFRVESYKNKSIILMEYVDSKSPNQEDMSHFGRQLAQLHSRPTDHVFGWEENNFIGNLHQSNNKNHDWTSFFVEERLLPQLKLAFDSGLLNKVEIPLEEKLSKTCRNMFPDVKPSLLHGDLWSGNFLVSKHGVPYIIDPATYYGHHEVDIAMTRLFGGFGDSFYCAYREFVSPELGEEERMDIYQLYYLLVHLNLFGSSYRAPVKRILSTYF